tara:strand:+ start:1000 stop:1779 length:780 start_codon:yes stop_codon:yes gene_type:complete
VRKHISFSELKIWNECAFKHKLVYIDEVKKFLGSEHTAFGTAMHYVCEVLMKDNFAKNLHEVFEEKFLDELKFLKKSNVEINSKLVQDMRSQSKNIISFILPAVKKQFKNFNLISIEEKLFETIEDNDQKFKGFVDLVIQTSDGMYHVIDWKTCSWGWDSRRKNDRMTSYQLTLYKHFFAKKHNVDVSNIDTHFALLKRTAKTNNVEIFRVTSGPKKTQNAIKLLNQALYNINNKKYIKNRLSCTSGFGCEFYKTEHCR